MPIINSCCCCNSLRKGCYASAGYTMGYFIITIVTMSHFIYVEQRYLRGELLEPESQSILEPAKITHLTVILNIILLGCSVLGVFGSIMLVIGVYKNVKYMLIPWLIAMALETGVEIINLFYLGYLQTVEFNPVTSFLFTMDFFIISLNFYAVVCVISQFQQYQLGRGTAEDDLEDQLPSVQYVAPLQNSLALNPAMNRRRSAGRARQFDPEDVSEAAPSMARPSIAPPASSLARPSRSNVKKHVQFPDEQHYNIDDPDEPTPPVFDEPDDKPESGAICSLWMELETEVPTPDR